MLALSAPGKLWLAGERAETAGLVKRMYQVAGATNNLTLHGAQAQARADEAVKWLLDQEKR
jgi:hypothetical protein